MALEQNIKDARNASGLAQGIRAVISKAEDLIEMLHEDYIPTSLPEPRADTHGQLDAVKAARKTTSRHSEIRRAAQNEIAQLQLSKKFAVVAKFVDSWLKCIYTYLYQSTLAGVAREALADARLASRNRYLEQFAEAYVQNQLDHGLIWEKDRARTRIDTLQWIREQIRTDPDQPLDPEVMKRVINNLGTGTVAPAAVDNDGDITMD